jgi:hypothetical protein
MATAATAANEISITGGLSAANLANSLVGQGIQISNVTLNCADRAAGTFLINGDVGIGLTSGIVLSTGLIDKVVGPNVNTGISSDNSMGGDGDLEALIAGNSTYDACVLEFDFIPQASIVSFKYVFASEEYNEYVGSSFNDVFGFFIDKINCATINNSNVSINSINADSNSGYYIDNTAATYNTEMDGFTKVLNCSAAVTAGRPHHLKLAIADAGDSLYDSNVFIGTQSLVSEQYGLFLSPNTLSQTAPCGTVAAYVLDLKNIGSLSDSYNLTLSSPQWPTVFATSGTNTMTVGPLSSMATTKILVNVSIPANVCPGNDSVTVTATSVVSPAITATSTLATTATSPLLKVSINETGTGSGTVNSTSPPSPSIACPGKCSANFPYGSTITLSAVPAWHSLASWPGCATTGNVCSVHMNSDMTLTASFVPNDTVLRSGKSTKEYATLESAYNDSASGDTLNAQAMTYFEDLVLNLPVNVKLNGGLDSSYGPTAGFTSIKGSLKIRGGKLSCSKVVVIEKIP